MSRYLIFLLVLITSCSTNQTLNLKGHQYGKKSNHIIWIQVAGLSEEHLALLKFDKGGLEKARNFEEFQCVGKLWSYNYYSLRPSAFNGFSSQLTGSKDITGSCSDLGHKPLWDYLKNARFDIGVFETQGVSGNSLTRYQNCPGDQEFFDKVTLWKMERSKNKENQNFFHYQKEAPITPGVFFDKSCEQKGCFASFKTNLQAIWKSFSKKQEPKFLLIRDFSFYNALKRGEFKEARRFLSELSDLITILRSEKTRDQKTIILSSSESLLFEFPREGSEWAKFLMSGKKMNFRQSSLVSSLWAIGPSAENFCGLYNESEVLKRILWQPEGDAFGLDGLKNVLD